MIGRLTGTIAHEGSDGTVVIDVRGVGYEVMVPLGTAGRATRAADGSVTLFVHTHVREDAFTLFGFSDERERTAFRTLISVAGIGPKIAVGILGSLPSTDLAAAIARGDVKRLQSVPGVGKKIAERLALELKDKLGSAAWSIGTNGGAMVPQATAPTPSRRAGSLGRLVDALTRMGFKPAEAERAANELKARESEPIDTLVREALQILTA
jgi:Holliday junction DNA helicase RuvA